jgi:hypothetical protein
MPTIEKTETATIFELTRFVDGHPTPYVPYTSDCGSCCAPTSTESASSCGCGTR